MKKITWVLLCTMLATTLNVFASSTTQKQIDNIQNSTGGSSLAVPSVGSTLDTDSNTLTLSNKSIDGGSNTFSNIPVTAIATGTGLSVSRGGTGDTTLTLNGMVYGNGTSAAGITAAGSQYQSFQAGASGVPTVGAIQLNQSAAVSGQLAVANGGTGAASLTVHGVVIGNTTSAVNVTSAGTAGQVLTSNGASADPTFQAVSVSPSLNGSQASPQSVTAGGGISLSSISYSNFAFVVSNSGSVTVTATPSITACTAAGQLLYITGESASNIITLQDEAALAGSKLRMNGNWTSGLNHVLTLLCDGNGFWIEQSRQN